MATKVYDTYEFELMDGNVITARPLTIKRLREFMKEFAKVSAANTETDEEGNEKEPDQDKAIQGLLKCVHIAFKQYEPKYTLAELEDVLDLQTLYKIIEVASGIRMVKDGDDEGNV